ncbi:MAG: hypothetical protein ABFR89_02605, partial [Actinomycetota bacterium]
MKVQPADYTKLHWTERRKLREQYVVAQEGLCFHCGCDLAKPAPNRITSMAINWSLFPDGFLTYPVHLQHDHDTGMT